MNCKAKAKKWVSLETAKLNYRGHRCTHYTPKILNMARSLIGNGHSVHILQTA